MLQFYCEQIPGDATLHSMFKIDADPVKCPTPLKGMFMQRRILILFVSAPSASFLFLHHRKKRELGNYANFRSLKRVAVNKKKSINFQ
jgi:hypothetical protein